MKSTILFIVAAFMVASLGFAQEKAAPQAKEKKAEVTAPAASTTKAPAADQGTMQKEMKKAPMTMKSTKGTKASKAKAKTSAKKSASKKTKKAAEPKSTTPPQN